MGLYLTANDWRIFLINLIVRNVLILDGKKMSPWSFIIICSLFKSGLIISKLNPEGNAKNSKYDPFLLFKVMSC